MIVERVPLTEEPIAGKDAVERYDKYAGLYIKPEYGYFVRKILNRGIRSGKVLDIGAGSGRLAIELAKAKNCNFDIIGLDISENMLQKARKNAREGGVESKIKFILASGSELPFPEKSFDLVMSYASLHHWFHPILVFNEIQRVVKAEGTIIIRDNRRIYGNPFWGAFIWAISRFMNKCQRDLWPKAILASYTVAEIQSILKQSKMKDYQVGTDFVKFDICIEALPNFDIKTHS